MLNDIVTWAATVNLEAFIGFQYWLMGFFTIGAFTSSNNRNKRVFISNLATLVAVLLAFYFRGVISFSATRFTGTDGPNLAGLINNDVFRTLFNFVLLFALLYRMVRTCCHMKMRELKFEWLTSFRKRRIPNA